MNIKFTKEKIIAIAGVALVLIGEFLPFITASAYGVKASTNFISGTDGILVLVAVIAGLATFLFGKGKKLAFNTPSSAVGFSIAITMYDAFLGGGQSRKNLIALGGKVTLNIGFYLVIVGLVLFLLGIFLESKNSKSTMTGNNNGYSYAGGNGVTYQNDQSNQYSMPNQNAYAQPTYSAPTQSAQPTYSAPTQPTQPAQQTYSAPTQPAQPTYSAPTQPAQSAQPTYSAPAQQPIPEVNAQPENKFFNSEPVQQPGNVDNVENLSDSIFRQ